MQYKKNDKEESCVYVDILDHRQYLEILSKIRKDTYKIVIVQIDGYKKDDPVVDTAMQMMPLEKKETVSRWFGTAAPGRQAVQYTFTKKREFFGYLSSFEAFYIRRTGKKNCYELEYTDFGLDDIAFLDENDELLFFTVTHEGFAFLNKKYL